MFGQMFSVSCSDVDLFLARFQYVVQRFTSYYPSIKKLKPKSYCHVLRAGLYFVSKAQQNGNIRLKCSLHDQLINGILR